jgi:NTE family protein
MTDVGRQFTTSEEGPLDGLFNSPKFQAEGIGLALSGGGYKAAAYHLGALIRLNEVGLLSRIDRISSVSGGSIAAGFLGLRWKDLSFDADGVATNFRAVFVEPLREFLTEANLDIQQGLLGLLLPFRSGADGIAKGYDQHLFKGATLQDLPGKGEGPEFVLVATNYELNSLWRFSQAYAADYRIGRIDQPTFPLARIVAASSAFPPFFCPLELDFGSQTPVRTDGANRHSGRFLERALLCDGGIYDNMGLEPIWKRYGVLLVSNAGDTIDEDDVPKEWAGLMLRIIGLMHRQAENNRQRTLMLLAMTKARKVAYWPLRNTTNNYPKPSAVVPTPTDVSQAQAEAVRLWSLGNKAFSRVANHGYSMSDSAIGSYLDRVGPSSVLPF